MVKGAIDLPWQICPPKHPDQTVPPCHPPPAGTAKDLDFINSLKKQRLEQFKQDQEYGKKQAFAQQHPPTEKLVYHESKVLVHPSGTPHPPTDISGYPLEKTIKPPALMNDQTLMYNIGRNERRRYALMAHEAAQMSFKMVQQARAARYVAKRAAEKANSYYALADGARELAVVAMKNDMIRSAARKVERLGYDAHGRYKGPVGDMEKDEDVDKIEEKMPHVGPDAYYFVDKMSSINPLALVFWYIGTQNISFQASSSIKKEDKCFL